MIAHRIEEQLESAQARAFRNSTTISITSASTAGDSRADGLRADLKELPVAAFLRALTAEHGAHVIELLHAGTLIEAVFDVGADDDGGIFGAQGERRFVAVGEGVHLLGDDVGFFAYAAREELRFFQDGRADFVVVVGPENGAGHCFHMVPHRGGWR